MKRRNFLWYSLLFVVGCTTRRNNSDTVSSNSNDLSSSEALRFVVTDVQGLEKLERDYESFRTALEDALGRKIEFFPVNSYTETVPALQFGQVDMALTGPSEYVVIRARTNAVPVVAITRPNYHAAIAIPTNSGIESVEGLRGKTIAMSKVGSTSGHIGPTKLLLDAGLDPKSDYKVLMLGQEGSLEALKNGRVDAWAGPWIDYNRFLRTEGLSERDIPLLKKGPLLPRDVFVLSSRIKPELIDDIRSRMVEHQTKLIKALTIAPANEKYKNSQFVTANDVDYNMIREVYQGIGEGQFFSGEE